MTAAETGGGRQPPAYQRLSDDLRAKLTEGYFAPEERMPTELELAREYGLSRQTVRRAFLDLVSEGLVHRVPGRGTFPSNFVRHGHYLRSIGAIEDLQSFAGTEMELIQRIELVADEESSRRLELGSKVVAKLALRRFYEGKPFSVTYVYLSPVLGQRLAEADALPRKGAGTVIGVLEGFVPGSIAGANQTITAVAIPADVAALIEYKAGGPGLRAERLYYDSEDKPVELAVSYYNPDRYTYRLQMRRRTS